MLQSRTSSPHHITSNISPHIAYTKEQWNSLPIITIPNVLLIEIDTNKLKLSDGRTVYSELPYLVSGTLSDEHKALLDNLNNPEGLVKLNKNGKIPADLMPKIALDTNYPPRTFITETYATMVAACNDPDLSEYIRRSIVEVTDARDDPSGVVTSNKDVVWYHCDIDGVEHEITILRDFNIPYREMVHYLKVDGGDVDTMGSITDDTDPTNSASDKYLKFSYADKQVLNSLSGTGDTTTSTIVMLMGSQINAKRLAELMTTI